MNVRGGNEAHRDSNRGSFLPFGLPVKFSVYSTPHLGATMVVSTVGGASNIRCNQPCLEKWGGVDQLTRGKKHCQSFLPMDDQDRGWETCAVRVTYHSAGT